jgi:hypothetical protein
MGKMQKKTFSRPSKGRNSPNLSVNSSSLPPIPSPVDRTEATPTRILLIDDDPIFRLGLRTALEAFPDLQVVAEADTV